MKLGVEIDRLSLPYIIPRQTFVKPIHTSQSGYNPDVIVLDWLRLNQESFLTTEEVFAAGV